jgi:hypothetical protein
MQLSTSLSGAVFAIPVLASQFLVPVDLQVPQHRVVETKDVSFGVVRRFSVRVSLPQHYERSQIEQVAKAVVADLTAKQRVNAIMIFFYGPNADVTGVFDVARVEWAPNGRWEDAATVRAGDYSSFRYTVTYNPLPVRQSLP